MSDRAPPFPYKQPTYWSLLKLELLEKYSEAVAAILGAGGHRVTFVDLMAAEGYYASGDPGSTGRLASIAERNAAAGRVVRCIAYESNTAAFARLRANVAQVTEWVDVRNERWEEHTSELLAELRGDFVLFFVDPMGLISWRAPCPASPTISFGSDGQLLVDYCSKACWSMAEGCLVRCCRCRTARRGLQRGGAGLRPLRMLRHQGPCMSAWLTPMLIC